MSVKSKYQTVLDLGETLGSKEGYVTEEGNTLKLGGLVSTQYEKDLLWDKIKEVGGKEPSDIIADIRVETTDYYARYTVKKGDTLGKIAKHFFKDPMKYKLIFEANRDILSNPDLIEVGQDLIIPND